MPVTTHVSEERLRLELEKRLMAQMGSHQLGPLRAADSPHSEYEFDFSHLAELSRIMQESAYRLGSVPPAPATSRGRAGAILVRAVRRMLSWYTLQIAAFHSLAARGSREALLGLRHHNRALVALKLDLTRADQELASLRTALDQHAHAAREQAARLEASIADLRAENLDLRRHIDQLQRD